LEEADRLARAMIAAGEHRVAAHTLAARIALRRDDGRAALEALRQALRLDPYDRQALHLLQRLEARR
jgi:cytochrome c-type biogenesis protein CcmH/NrfG